MLMGWRPPGVLGVLVLNIHGPPQQRPGVIMMIMWNLQKVSHTSWPHVAQCTTSGLDHLNGHPVLYGTGLCGHTSG